MTRFPSRLALTAASAFAAFLSAATPVAAQDEITEHQQRVEAQQAEERRMNDIARQMNEDVADMQANEYGEPEYAPNSFVTFPPEAWNDWVEHGKETHRQELEDRFGSDPAYQALVRGTWTYRQSAPGDDMKICAATFWTRNGGVSFVHLGGDDDFTLLGFFGLGIPRVKSPRTISLELIQSGESQSVRATNIGFGSVKSMGMVLFNVHSPAILAGAIEDNQDFEIRLDGNMIAQGDWHSGLEARAELTKCLEAQGYLGPGG